MTQLRLAAFAVVFLAPSLSLAETCQTGLASPLGPPSCKLVIGLPQVSSDRASDQPMRSIGAKRIVVPKHEPAFNVGDEFPVYRHSMLIDPPRYGLPPVNGNWRYYKVDRDTYRVDAASLKVLEVVDTAGNSMLR